MRRFRWIFLAALLSFNCASLKRTPRTVITVDGQMQTVVDLQEGGCGDDGYSRRTHRQVGGGASFREETADGIVTKAQIRLVRGRLIKEEFNPGEEGNFGAATQRRYFLGSLGASAGVDRQHMGFELGATGIALGLEDATIIPWIRLKFGWLESGWFELSGGPSDPLFVADILSAGLGWRTEVLRLRLGAMAYGQIVDVLDSQPAIGLAHEGSLNAAAYGEFEWTPKTQNVGMTFGGFLGKTRGFKIGFAHAF